MSRTTIWGDEPSQFDSIFVRGQDVILELVHKYADGTFYDITGWTFASYWFDGDALLGTSWTEGVRDNANGSVKFTATIVQTLNTTTMLPSFYHEIFATDSDGHTYCDALGDVKMIGRRHA